MSELHDVPAAESGPGLTWRQRLRLAVKIAQVRLRFIVVLVAAFLIVGKWGTLRNYWDRLLHRVWGTTAATQTVSDDTEFFCPMDPGVVSNWPAICPVCNMDLVRRKKGDAALLPSGVVARMQFSPYRVQLAGIRTSLVEPRTLQGAEVLAVPESAVIDTGHRQVVYVESMPGMFDGVEVTLGPRCEDYYPVTKGLAAGQRVASYGAFLIDAEARLNPNLAAGYFGATQSNGTAPIRGAPQIEHEHKSTKPKRPKLSPADQVLADRQEVCPVTDLPLDSMGGPLAIDVSGRKVFICCEGCEERLQSEPGKYLAKLKPAQ